MLGRLITGIMIIPTLISAAAPVPTQAQIDLKAIWRGESLDKYMFGPAPRFKFKNIKQLHQHLTLVARRHALPVTLLKQIVAVESSNCKYRTNKITNDNGCFQINKTTQNLYGFSDSVIDNDMLNAEAAAIILKDLKKLTIKRLREKWPCSYNIGTRNLMVNCDNYLAKLSSAVL